MVTGTGSSPALTRLAAERMRTGSTSLFRYLEGC